MKPPIASLTGLAVRGLDERLQSGPEGRWQRRNPASVDEPDIQQVAQVRAVLIAKRGEFDLHECSQFEHADVAKVAGVLNSGVGQGFPRSDGLVRERKVHAGARAACRTIEKHIQTCRMTVHEARLRERLDAPGKVGSLHEHINVLGVANCLDIHGCHPRRDGVPTNHRVRDVARAQGSRGTHQASANKLHRSLHAIKDRV